MPGIHNEKLEMRGEHRRLRSPLLLREAEFILAPPELGDPGSPLMGRLNADGRAERMYRKQDKLLNRRLQSCRKIDIARPVVRVSSVPVQFGQC